MYNDYTSCVLTLNTIETEGSIGEREKSIFYILSGLPTLDAKKRIFSWIFLIVLCIDIDIKVVKFNKYTLEIHKKNLFIYFSHFLYTKHGRQT